MTHKEAIINYLKRQPSWVSARDMQRIFFSEMNPDTLTRECRRLREDGVIEKKDSKFNEYRLIREGQLRIC